MAQRREVFYTLEAVNRRLGIRLPMGTYPRRVEAMRDGLALRGGWHGDVRRHSVPLHG